MLYAMFAATLRDLWTLSGPWRYLGDVNAVLPPLVVGVVVTGSAVLCGCIIGGERERAEKPAGMRTFALICLGAAMFTLASLLLADENTDRTRIAAQVVTGIGFLGAGAIIRDGGTLVGVTTAATIWATAAIGVLVGAGYVAPGLALSVMVLITVKGLQRIERAIGGKCEFRMISLRFDPDGGKSLPRIEELVEVHRGAIAERIDVADRVSEIKIRYCIGHKEHRELPARLAELSAVKEIKVLE